MGVLLQSDRKSLRSSHGMVVEAVGRAIVSGRYTPGSFLARDDVMTEQYAVSCTVVREAMKTLAGKGLILAQTKIGTSVLPRKSWNMFDAQVLSWHLARDPGQSFYDQLFDMRLAIEPFAAALAARNASDAQIAELMRLVARMRTSHDAQDFAIVDLAFHQTILDAAGNEFLFSGLSMIEVALLTVMRMSSPTNSPERQSDIADRHAAIANAIAARNEAEVEAAMRDAIVAGRERIIGATH